MPELPEVETIVRELATSSLVGSRIVKVSVFWPRTLADHSVAEFTSALEGQKILSIVRHGKWLLFVLDGIFLYVHLRMTGKFFFGSSDEKPHCHERVRLLLDDGRILRFEDQRKFGRWKLVSEEKDAPLVGADPFSKEFTLSFFQKVLQSHKQTIKSFLLSQKHVCGLGNIYVDEALWEAGIHPLQRTNDLLPKESRALFKIIPQVLKKGIDHTGTTLGNAKANYYSVSGRRGNNQHSLNVFRRHGLSCPRCGATIQRLIVAQRGTHICPGCQKYRQ